MATTLQLIDDRVRIFEEIFKRMRSELILIDVLISVIGS